MNPIKYTEELTKKMNIHKDDYVSIEKIQNLVMNALFLGNVLSKPLPKETDKEIRRCIASTKDITPIEIKDPLELMCKVNNYIKTPEVTTPERNEFYKEKHKMIKYYLGKGRVTKIIKTKINTEEGFLFTIDDKYHFHQPQRMFPEMIINGEITGEHKKEDRKEETHNLTR